MKRFTQIVCLILVLSLTLAIPVCATSASPWASNYFTARSCYLWDVSSTGFQVWFEVTAKRTMTELGASIVTVQRSSDTVNWTPVKTYYKSDYPQMTTTAGKVAYSGYVTFDEAESGYYYRANVEFYAKDNNGSAIVGMNTSYVYIP